MVSMAVRRTAPPVVGMPMAAAALTRIWILVPGLVPGLIRPAAEAYLVMVSANRPVPDSGSLARWVGGGGCSGLGEREVSDSDPRHFGSDETHLAPRSVVATASGVTLDCRTSQVNAVPLWPARAGN